MVAGMNGGSHAAMATWGLEKIDIPQAGEILDIGCGGGANIARLLARSKAAKVAIHRDEDRHWLAVTALK